MTVNDLLAADRVSSKYGAPMGRPSIVDRPYGPVRLGRVTLESGYDAGGAYWGEGTPLYVAIAPGPHVGDRPHFRVFRRARDRAAVRETLNWEFPEIETSAYPCHPRVSHRYVSLALTVRDLRKVYRKHFATLGPGLCRETARAYSVLHLYRSEARQGHVLGMPPSTVRELNEIFSWYAVGPGPHTPGSEVPPDSLKVPMATQVLRDIGFGPGSSIWESRAVHPALLGDLVEEAGHPDAAAELRAWFDPEKPLPDQPAFFTPKGDHPWVQTRIDRWRLSRPSTEEWGTHPDHRRAVENVMTFRTTRAIA